MKSPRPLNLAGKALLLLLAIAASVIPGMAGTRVPTAAAGGGAGWIVADFDGDHKPDLVELRRSFLILQLSTGAQQRLRTSTDDAPGMEIDAVDVNGDSHLDIVVRSRFLAQRVKIWLNDGKGVFSENVFRQAPGPVDRGNWNPAQALIPVDAISMKLPSLIPGRNTAGLVPVPRSGGSIAEDPERRATVWNHTTSRLRAPPSAPFV